MEAVWVSRTSRRAGEAPSERKSKMWGWEGNENFARVSPNFGLETAAMTDGRDFLKNERLRVSFQDKGEAERLLNNPLSWLCVQAGIHF